MCSVQVFRYHTQKNDTKNVVEFIQCGFEIKRPQQLGYTNPSPWKCHHSIQFIQVVLWWWPIVMCESIGMPSLLLLEQENRH